MVPAHPTKHQACKKPAESEIDTPDEKMYKMTMDYRAATTSKAHQPTASRAGKSLHAHLLSTQNRSSENAQTLSASHTVRDHKAMNSVMKSPH